MSCINHTLAFCENIVNGEFYKLQPTHVVAITNFLFTSPLATFLPAC